jgi:hypothetical protein
MKRELFPAALARVDLALPRGRRGETSGGETRAVLP